MSIGLDGPPASLANKVAAGAAGLVLLVVGAGTGIPTRRRRCPVGQGHRRP
ncbi:MAG: hypothetical protein ABSF89_13120 [Acidimicrobiales bacterium]